LIFTYFNPNLKYIIKTDLSDYVLGGLLSQYNKNGKLCLIAFFSQKLAPAESNYEIYNKELFTIIKYFKQWRLEFKGSLFLIYILIDYKNLQYFITTKQLI
jgi:RNase H-like domain found in reverse transcriptase